MLQKRTRRQKYMLQKRTRGQLSEKLLNYVQNTVKVRLYLINMSDQIKSTFFLFNLVITHLLYRLLFFLVIIYFTYPAKFTPNNTRIILPHVT